MNAAWPVRAGLVILACITLLASALAQEIQEQVEVELVQVDVTATDSKGTMIRDLTAQDFVVKEDGVVQKVDHFYNAASENDRYPLAVSFLVDTSYSMHEKVAGMTRIEIALDAAELVMNQLNEGDSIELIEFNNRPEVVVPFTSDLESVWDRFESLEFQKANTAMHDSIVFALQRIREQSGRRIILIFSDGMDSASRSVEDDVLDAIRKSDTTLIAFYSEIAGMDFPGGGIMGNNPNPVRQVQVGAGEDLLREYAEVSGGQFFSFRKEAELAKAMDGLRELLKSQYTLAYTPAAARKKIGWRKIKVECKRKGVRLRYRDGYWAG